MAHPKLKLTILMDWRAKGREIHAEMMEVLGVGFPESHLMSAVDGFLMMGGEGQTKAWALAKRNQPKKPRVQTKKVNETGEAKKKAKKPKKGSITKIVRMALDSTPRTGKEIQMKAQKALPGLNSDQVVKILASMVLRQQIKRKTDTTPYQYYV